MHVGSRVKGIFRFDWRWRFRANVTQFGLDDGRIVGPASRRVSAGDPKHPNPAERSRHTGREGAARYEVDQGDGR
jgi:hypothetical protein